MKLSAKRRKGQPRGRSLSPKRSSRVRPRHLQTMANGHPPETKASPPGNGNGDGHSLDIKLAPPEKNAGNGSDVKEGKEAPKEGQKTANPPTEAPQAKTKSAEKSGGNGKDKGKAEAAQKSGGNGQDKTKEAPPPKMSEAQKRAIYNLSRRRGISVEQLEKMSQEKYKVSVEMLTPSDASSFIRNLQQSA